MPPEQCLDSCFSALWCLHLDGDDIYMGIQRWKRLWCVDATINATHYTEVRVHGVHRTQVVQQCCDRGCPETAHRTNFFLAQRQRFSHLAWSEIIILLTYKCMHFICGRSTPPRMRSTAVTFQSSNPIGQYLVVYCSIRLFSLVPKHGSLWTRLLFNAIARRIQRAAAAAALLKWRAKSWTRSRLQQTLLLLAMTCQWLRCQRGWKARGYLNNTARLLKVPF